MRSGMTAASEVVAVGAPMAAVPRWSRLWTAVDTNGARLVTWENFALGRDTNAPVNAQIELRTTGDFVTRSNEVETVCLRVDPEDWDGDGWQNDDDPDPCNADEFGDEFCQELPYGANEAAYCWIEIRPRWNSWIEFYGDGPSDLDDPCFWAKAGETYRVTLLIGKTYAVESSRPIDVVGRSSPSVEVDGDGTCALDVVWPVRFSALEGNGASFMMRVVPSSLGGETGGTASFSIFNGDKLLTCAGGSLPVTRFVPPRQKLGFEIEYEGLRPSDALGDIVARSDFTEHGTGTRHATAKASLTSVKVELTAVYDAPENHNPNRHVYGVGEKVNFCFIPSSSELDLSVIKEDRTDRMTVYDTFAGEQNVRGCPSAIYTCPASGTIPNITISYLDARYSPELLVIEPQYVQTPSASSDGVFWPGEVCMGSLITVNHIGPMTVSFRGVKIFEVPCTNAVPPIGYFATTNFNGNLMHDLNAEAGWIHPIDEGNYWATDRAGRSEPYENWSAGRLEWKIPIGWARYRSEIDNVSRTDHCDYAEFFNDQSRSLLIGNREDAYMQIYTIEEDGTSAVEKFGYKLTRNRLLPFGTVTRIGETE